MPSTTFNSNPFNGMAKSPLGKFTHLIAFAIVFILWCLILAWGFGWIGTCLPSSGSFNSGKFASSASNSWNKCGLGTYSDQTQTSLTSGSSQNGGNCSASTSLSGSTNSGSTNSGISNISGGSGDSG